MSVERTSERRETREAFLDAAERLLVEVGHAGVTTRRLAAEADANQGLVHYYFGSIDELFIQVLERFTERLVARQRAMYAAEDRKSTRLNSSHANISYAVLCLKKKHVLHILA